MKNCIIYTCLALMSAFSNTSSAQYNTQRNNELSIGEGIVSLDQVMGIVGNAGGPVSVYMSFPNSITGAAFITYHHYFSRRLAVGLSVGLDNQTGDITYGDEHHGSFGGSESGTNGTYYRKAFTFAPELTFAYVKTNRFMFYGLAGAGYTYAYSKFVFNQGMYDPEFFYGTSTSLLPSNNYKWQDSHFNFQLSPVGIRFGGDFAGFLEFGFGYKGVISGGLSARF